MDKRTTAVVSYFSIIGWIISFAAGDREGAKFHMNQSLIINIISILIGAARGVVNHILFFIFRWPFELAFGLISLVLGILWLIGLIYAIRDEEKPVPIIGYIQIIK